MLVWFMVEYLIKFVVMDVRENYSKTKDLVRYVGDELKKLQKILLHRILFGGENLTYY